MTLGEYVAALIAELGRAHPSTLARLRLVVGRRRARIALDDEAVEVFFDGDGRLQVLSASDAGAADGAGETDTPTVLRLLDGEEEVSGAVLGDRLRVTGEDDDVVRMFTAIEILLDASPRTPALQSLAAKFIGDRRGPAASRPPVSAQLSWYPFRPEPGELRLLARLDLLPDDS